MSNGPYPSGKRNPALFRYKVGQRVYHTQSCQPCVIQSRYRSNGYSRYKVVFMDGGTMAVHIVMYVIEHGPIPPRKQIEHKCRNRLCVNPHHLEMVTHKQNQRRRDAARRMKCEPLSPP